LVGNEYVINNYYAHDYKTGKDVLASLSVKAGSTSLSVIDGVLLAKSSSVLGDTLTFTYTAGNAEKVVYRPLIDAETDSGVDILKYFYTSENVTAIEYFADDDSVPRINATSDGEFTFVNPLLAQGLSYRFKGVPEKNDFETIIFKLTDSLDKTKSVSFPIKKFGGYSSLVTVNGKNWVLKRGFENISTTTMFNISYINGFIDISSELREKIALYDNGETFNGFPSGYAYVTVEFEGVGSNGVAIDVDRVWGMSLSVMGLNESGDERKPLGDFASDLGGTYQLGESVTIPVALAFDVIDCSPTATMVVRDPDLLVVTSNEGVKLDGIKPDKEHSITLNKVGTYVVAVTIKDAYGNKATVSREIKVKKTVEPVITVNSYATNVTQGDNLNIGGATAVDMNGNNLDVYVYVFDGEGAFNLATVYKVNEETGQYVSNTGVSYKTKFAGMYKIIYTAKDSAGNVAFTSYEVKVNAKVGE
jgi:hypothetical protein